MPQGMKVFASGSQAAASRSRWPTASPATSTTSTGTKPGFPGTVIAGRYVGPISRRPRQHQGLPHRRPPAARPTSWRRPLPRSIDFFTDSFGIPESSHLNVVELPDDTLPAVWAPELAAILGSRVGDKSGIRLLANTIAHQWWGSEV